MMQMLVLTAALALAAAISSAQVTPDFSGTWTFDQSKSDPPPQLGGGGAGGGRGGGGRGGGGGPTLTTLVIKQTTMELRIEGQSGGQTISYVHKLDGSESTNDTPRGKLKSRSRWEDHKLVTEGTRTVETPQGTREIQTKEVRSLGQDGKTMIVENTTNTPMGSTTRKLVYQKSV